MEYVGTRPQAIRVLWHCGHNSTRKWLCLARMCIYSNSCCKRTANTSIFSQKIPALNAPVCVCVYIGSCWQWIGNYVYVQPYSWTELARLSNSSIPWSWLWLGIGTQLVVLVVKLHVSSRMAFFFVPVINLPNSFCGYCCNENELGQRSDLQWASRS